MRRLERAVRLIALLALPALSPLGQAQQPAQPQTEAPGADTAPTDDVAASIDVVPATDDDAIEARIARILAATQWFESAAVTVDEGIVFLRGQAVTEERRAWAERVARNTEDVVAVVNELEIAPVSLLDLTPAWDEMRRLGAAALRHTPLIAAALILLLVTWFVSRRSAHLVGSLLRRKVKSPLLRDVVARTAAIPVFLIGLYVVLSVLGLTGLAVTVIGGTGLLGLVIGFAFREIAENFLASVLLSMQRPFAVGDLIEVAGFTGFVQSVNTRSTLLMTHEGNHVQIPNATIYKNTITNFTANPIARHNFAIGIGYEDSVAEAQSVASRVLAAHSAISDEPEPLVLVESLDPSTVRLRAYFWIDVTRYSPIKVLSSAIRLTKRAFIEAGISMPDEAREVVFPRGVPVAMTEAASLGEAERMEPAPPEQRATRQDAAESVEAAEGDLATEADEIDRQAKRARVPEGTTNLLAP